MALKVYSFGFGEKVSAGKDILGGKGAGLVEMCNLGVNVPPGFILPTTAWKAYRKDPEATMQEVRDALPAMFVKLNKKFGYSPLVSVRSGAPVSCPGMMDTILNVGLCEGNLLDWSQRLGQACVKDSYNRLLSMYADVVGSQLPINPMDQLVGAIEAVFKSWDNERAQVYRKMNKISDAMGTAVVIQTMVFGNLNDKSATGVLFTRNPSTGEGKVVGEFLVNAQGEDVVAGLRTPQSLDEISNWNDGIGQQLLSVALKLEDHYRDMQDVEWTVQDGELFILQTRNGKRTGQAAIKIAVDLCDENVLPKAEAVKKVSLKQYLAAIKPTIAPTFNTPPVAVGLPASNGVAIGMAVFSAEAAIQSKEPCILISEETTPDDIAGMAAAKGVLTSKGGATSHAAVVARGMDRVCVVGCSALKKSGNAWVINGESGVQTILPEGTTLTVDGSTGRVWIGEVPIIDGAHSPELARFRELVAECSDFVPLVTSVKEAVDGTYLMAGALSAPWELAKLPMKTGYVDVTPWATMLDDHSIRFMAMFGNTPVNTYSCVEALLARKGDNSGIKVVGNVGATLALNLAAAGYKVVPLLQNLNDLIMASGEYMDQISPEVPQNVVTKVLALKEKAGEVLRPIELCETLPQEPEGVVVMTELQLIQSVLA